MRRRRFSLLLPLLACLACERPEPTVSPAPVPAADISERSDDAQDTASAQPSSNSNSSIDLAKLSRVQARSFVIAEEIARARALERTSEFKVELVNRAGVRDFVVAEMYEQLSPEKIRLLGRIEASLGVLPLGSDAEAILLDLYEEGVLGIYDPKRKTLLIGDYVEEEMLDMVVGHEIAHALQDMHFDLEALQKPVDGQSDRDAAKTFLVEGGAQAAFTVWAMRGGPSPEDIQRQRIMANNVLALAGQVSEHGILIRMLQMPYTDGTATVLEAVGIRGWGFIDDLYERLPASSEQMLHLDKLLRDELPRPITIDPAKALALFPEHKQVWEDELGEAFFLAALSEFEAPDVARAAAAGWDGDRYLAFDHAQTPAAAPLLLGMVAWDSTDDAKDFTEKFTRYLDETQKGRYLLDRRGDRVLYALQLPQGLTVSVRDLWRSVESGKRPAGTRR